MILALESSCDESAVAVLNPETGLLKHWLHSQVEQHQAYGGVVPELASREHSRNFEYLLEQAFKVFEPAAITQIAVTTGPGLAGCLAIGLASAKALALALELPLLGVHHLRAHAFSPFLTAHTSKPESFAKFFQAQLPHLGLIASGGHTSLVYLESKNKLECLAQTHDDAAGEALDKAARMLDMPYPGGPHVEAEARKGSAEAFAFPSGLADASDLRFSFSGLKTSLRYRLDAMEPDAISKSKADLCASYQKALVAQLIRKTRHTLDQKPVASLGLSGGVAQNETLRTAFKNLAAEVNIPLHLVEPIYAGDNAAMVAFAAWLSSESTLKDTENLELGIRPSWPVAFCTESTASPQH